MPLDPKLEIGAQLALTLASLFVPGSDKAVTGLGALFAAVKSYNASTGKEEGYVPSHDELTAFIDYRKSRHIPDV